MERPYGSLLLDARATGWGAVPVPAFRRISGSGRCFEPVTFRKYFYFSGCRHSDRRCRNFVASRRNSGRPGELSIDASSRNSRRAVLLVGIRGDPLHDTRCVVCALSTPRSWRWCRDPGTSCMCAELRLPTSLARPMRARSAGGSARFEARAKLASFDLEQTETVSWRTALSIAESGEANRGVMKTARALHTSARHEPRLSPLRGRLCLRSGVVRVDFGSFRFARRRT